MKRFLKRFMMEGWAFVHPDLGGKYIYYHDIHDAVRYTDMSTPRSTLEAQLDSALASSFTFPETSPSATGELGICFDDGFRGIWDAREVFEKRKIFPLVFLALDLVGREGYLTWDEILELQQVGFKFASHTWSHRSLTEVSPEELPHELGDARSFLSDRLGRDVAELCFPRGLFSRTVLDACVSAGYRRVFSCIPGSVGSLPAWHKDVEVVPRNFAQGCTPGDFKALLKGGQSLFRRRYLKIHFKG